MTAVVGQLDLLAMIDADDRADALAEWVAKFQRADWVAPYDCGLGPADTVVSGWTCPACDQVEVNSFLLNNNHGYDPGRPGRAPVGDEPFGSICTRLRLLAGQEASRLAREAKAAGARS